MPGPFNLDTSNPGDTSIVSAFPANERTFRINVAGYLNTEHDISTGLHAHSQGSTATRDSITRPAGALFYNTDIVTLQFATAPGAPATWANIGQFPAGTVMLFQQATAPTGWTQVTTNNDKVLRIINDGTGGNTGGSWTISGLTSGAHTLTVAELPAHTHTVTVPAVGTQGFQAGSSAAAPLSTPTAYGTDNGTGGGGAHSHTLTADGTWRPAYVNVLSASKN